MSTRSVDLHFFYLCSTICGVGDSNLTSFLLDGIIFLLTVCLVIVILLVVLSKSLSLSLSLKYVGIILVRKKNGKCRDDLVHRLCMLSVLENFHLVHY